MSAQTLLDLVLWTNFLLVAQPIQRTWQPPRTLATLSFSRAGAVILQLLPGSCKERLNTVGSLVSRQRACAQGCQPSYLSREGPTNGTAEPDASPAG